MNRIRAAVAVAVVAAVTTPTMPAPAATAAVARRTNPDPRRVCGKGTWVQHTHIRTVDGHRDDWDYGRGGHLVVWNKRGTRTWCAVYVNDAGRRQRLHLITSLGGMADPLDKPGVYVSDHGTYSSYAGPIIRTLKAPARRHEYLAVSGWIGGETHPRSWPAASYHWISNVQ